MQEFIIKINDIHKSYYLTNGVEIPVLKGVDLKIKKGEFVTLMGESGSGKSTLLNIIGFLHHSTGGNYFFEGEDVSIFTNDDILSFIRNRKIGFIFQQFYLISKLTALENVLLPGLYLDKTSSDKIKIATDLLIQVGLGNKLHSYPGELSGGQQQRVSIARSLMNDPEIILADEPTGALDSITAVEIMDLMIGLKKKGKTIIMVTHTPLVAKYSDRVIFLKDGKVTDCDYKLKEE
ncbi:MAG: ABC transporter ATP-binding protein [Candidatus Gracilibacteria bacterium]|nr:ABC transporter ATP-binding protein [Candidatus Gracilibacteria bacterium]